MKSRYTFVEFPVLCHYVVHVEVTSDLKKTLKKYPRTKNIEMDGDEGSNTRAMAVHEKGEPFSFLFLPYNADAGTVAHECWHVVRRMLMYTDINPDNEVIAYHLGYLVNEATKFLRGKRRA